MPNTCGYGVYSCLENLWAEPHSCSQASNFSGVVCRNNLTYTPAVPYFYHKFSLVVNSYLHLLFSTYTHFTHRLLKQLLIKYIGV